MIFTPFGRKARSYAFPTLERSRTPCREGEECLRVYGFVWLLEREPLQAIELLLVMVTRHLGHCPTDKPPFGQWRELRSRPLEYVTRQMAESQVGGGGLAVITQNCT